MLRHAKHRHGQVTALALVLMICLLGGSALAVDAGIGYAYKQRCEYTIEGAVLAAASQLPDPTAALNAARAVVQANGLDPGLLELTTPYQGDSRKVCVSFGDDRPTFFARAFGVSLIHVGTSAVAQQGTPAVFDYALFSGSTTERLNISGANINVTGHAHSNDSVRIRGSNVNVSGNLEASDVVDILGSNVHAGAILSHVPVVPMPEYNANELRAMCTDRYTGNQHWSGQNINVDGGVFVDGDLKLSGVNISGQGLIIATGEIELCGTNFRYHGSSDLVCLYALDRMKITGVNFTADGILYAPNGDIFCHGANLTVNGSAIADELDFGGTNVTVNHDPDAPAVFPSSGARLVR